MSDCLNMDAARARAAGQLDRRRPLDAVCTMLAYIRAHGTLDRTAMHALSMQGYDSVCGGRGFVERWIAEQVDMPRPSR